MLEKQFNSDLMYNEIVHYYIDKKGYTKQKANAIAQTVLRREIERRTCKNPSCGHMSHDHIRNAGTCLITTCDCNKFLAKDTS